MYINSQMRQCRLALGYTGSQNFATNVFKFKSYGLSIKGTAAAQGSTLGGGVQYLGVGFSNLKLYGNGAMTKIGF